MVTIHKDQEAKLLTPAQLRKRWSVSSMTLWRMRRRGQLKVLKIGTQVRIPLTEIERVEREATVTG